ncbi:hypothetical protein ALC57_15964 [Trachymyrmex cornetzi]|uniref:Uncharacterized protein n=1 Tax=Trachymyrmex cornetzi TaxID=471704 RepID=A0A195DG03_9HYME|nr:hypothetical protein ALC57_15964 [Trachymyrmex cornetzi]
MASAEESGGGGRAVGPVGTERDGERKREQGVAGGDRGESSRRCGGSGWMQENCARRVRKREGGYRAGGGVEEDEEEAASEQRRCQCARGRRVGPGVGVTSRRNRKRQAAPGPGS